MTTQARFKGFRPSSRPTVLLLGLVAALAAATGCGSSSSSSSSATSSQSHQPVTLTMWDLWSGEEGKPFNEAFKGFQKKYPWITVKQVVQPNTTNDTFDPNLVNAINGGNSPDVAMPFGPDYIGQYCSTGLWQDLTSDMKSANVSIQSFAPAAITYTNYGGHQCALPVLTDAFGLYYNKAMFAKAGIAGPPKTMDELMADAKKLTVFNPDGTIKIAGFVPLDQWEELGPGDLANAWGAKWFDSNNNPVIATDPGWANAFMWQRQLINFYGYNNITKFFAANTNNEFNPSNAFQAGKVAMTFDGEWRTQFIKRTAPKLNYGTAPFPAANPAYYGSARVGGTIVGIPKGAKHPDQAWLLVKYLATDTKFLVQLANGVGNVPTTPASASSPDLTAPPQFDTFLHVWANPKSAFAPPTQASGNGYASLLDNFESDWEAGKIATSDLHAALVKLDQNIQNQLSQGSAP
jgi:multiple sugar transport system substrate-binding protein